jgi:hypothetical protein
MKLIEKQVFLSSAIFIISGIFQMAFASQGQSTYFLAQAEEPSQTPEGESGSPSEPPADVSEPAAPEPAEPPAAPEPPKAETPRANPPVEPSSPNKNGTTAESTQIAKDLPRYVYVNEKSPFVALGISMVAGFGLGNFYAENPAGAYTHLFLETIGWGLFVAGYVVTDDDGDWFLERSEIKRANVDSLEASFLLSGLGLIITSRIIGSITAVSAVNEYNRHLQKQFRYKDFESSVFKLTPLVAVAPNNAFVGVGVEF